MIGLGCRAVRDHSSLVQIGTVFSKVWDEQAHRRADSRQAAYPPRVQVKSGHPPGACLCAVNHRQVQAQSAATSKLFRLQENLPVCPMVRRVPEGQQRARPSFFDELAEPHDGAKRETQVFWRNKLGSRRVGLNLTTPEADRA